MKYNTFFKRRRICYLRIVCLGYGFGGSGMRRASAGTDATVFVETYRSYWNLKNSTNNISNVRQYRFYNITRTYHSKDASCRAHVNLQLLSVRPLLHPLMISLPWFLCCCQFHLSLTLPHKFMVGTIFSLNFPSPQTKYIQQKKHYITR